jgi:hypothetical protein
MAGCGETPAPGAGLGGETALPAGAPCIVGDGTAVGGAAIAAVGGGVGRTLTPSMLSNTDNGNSTFPNCVNTSTVVASLRSTVTLSYSVPFNSLIFAAKHGGITRETIAIKRNSLHPRKFTAGI